MGPFKTVGQILDAIQTVKAGAPAFCTNFFPVQRKLQGWIDHGELLGELRDGVAWFLRQERGFGHLYFCAANLAVLQQELAALPCLKTERVVVDVVGREAALGGFVALLESGGFRCYARLCRMARASQPGEQRPFAADPRVVFAERADCPAIFELLNGSFDRFAEQLPLLYEIEAAVESRQILTAKCDGALAGLLFFETQGLTSTIRYWLVGEKFRAQRLGSAVIQHYFAAQSAVRRFILWVVADNENAVQKYRHYGFAPDGLVDCVLINEMIRP